MTLRRGAALAAPFLLVAIVARWAVPTWGDSIARHLLSVVAVVRGTPRPVRARAQTSPVPPFSSWGAAGGDGGSPWAAASGAGVASSLAVHLPAAVVQRAFDDLGPHVRGRTAIGTDGKPAGVALSGVAPLGVGLREGDLVVAVEGAPAPDEATATEIALVAIAHGATVLHAVAMRGDQPVLVTADMPPATPLSPPPAPVAGGKSR